MASISQINVNGTTYDIADTSAVSWNDVTDIYSAQGLNPITGTGVADALGTLATVASSGNYSDLSGTPTLATVATSGSYADLSNKPTIPTTASDISYQPQASGGILDGATDVDDALEIVDGLTIPTITYGTSDPSGGSNGDIYIKVAS